MEQLRFRSDPDYRLGTHARVMFRTQHFGRSSPSGGTVVMTEPQRPWVSCVFPPKPGRCGGHACREQTGVRDIPGAPAPLPGAGGLRESLDLTPSRTCPRARSRCPSLVTRRLDQSCVLWPPSLVATSPMATKRRFLFVYISVSPYPRPPRYSGPWRYTLSEHTLRASAGMRTVAP